MVLVVIDELVGSRDWPLVVVDCVVNGSGGGEYN